MTELVGKRSQRCGNEENEKTRKVILTENITFHTGSNPVTPTILNKSNMKERTSGDKVASVFNSILEFVLRGHFLQYDKIMHLLAGWAISSLFLIKMESTFTITVLVLIAVAVGKELWDKHKKKSKFDPFDLAMTLIGGALWLLIE